MKDAVVEKETLQWYIERLKEPELILKAFWVSSKSGDHLVVPPNNSSRVIGSIDADFPSIEEAREVAKQIQEEGIFTTIIKHPMLESWEVFYGDAGVIYDYCVWGEVDSGEVFGYSQEAIAEYMKAPCGHILQ